MTGPAESDRLPTRGLILRPSLGRSAFLMVKGRPEYAAAASKVSAPGTSDQFKPASCAAISGDRQIL